MAFPMKLKAPLKDYLWGGTRLKTDYFKRSPNLPVVAESWELSCHPDGLSVIAGGEFAGQTLEAYLKEHPEDWGSRAADKTRFPILIKLIDAAKDLSVQVHPDDAYALRVEQELGKNEAWYIIDCEPGARLIYGFDHEISREEFARRIADNTLLSVTHAVEVHPGDLFYIEAGTLHAIGAGILLAEIQQNSNTTYRVYDYGRLGADGKPRALHIEKALEVTRLEPARPREVSQSPVLLEGAEKRLLVDCPYFKTALWTVEEEVCLEATEESFLHLLMLEGGLELDYGFGSLGLIPGDSVFVPASMGEFELIGEGRLLVTELGDAKK